MKIERASLHFFHAGEIYMSTILIFIVIVLYSFQTLFCKLFTARYPGKQEAVTPLFCTIEGIFIFLFTFVWHGFRFRTDMVTLLLGIANALILWGYNTFLIKASEKGSYAFLNVMMLFGGIIVPIFYNSFILKSVPAPYQIGGIVLMLIACLLMNLKDIRLKETPRIYYLFCLLLFLFNGLYGVMLKVQSDHNEAQSGEMIMLTFGVMGLISLVQLICSEGRNTPALFRFNRGSIVALLTCLICAALAVNVVVLILPLVDISVYSTVANGGVLMLASLYAIFLFREKETPSTIIGIVLAVISITILSIS